MPDPDTAPMTRLIQGVAAVAERLAAVALALVGLLTAAAVTLRAFGTNLPDAIDLTSSLMAVAVFWGMVSAAARDDFIRVELADHLLGASTRRRLRAVAGAITAALLAALAYAGSEQLALIYASDEVTPELRMPLWPLSALAFSGLGATALVGLLLALARQGPREPAPPVAAPSQPIEGGAHGQ